MTEKLQYTLQQKKVRISIISLFVNGIQDIKAGIREKHIFTTLGWQDVAARYRRSRIGAFWLSLNMAVLITTLGIIFGSLFQAPIAEFLPGVAIGIIVWGFYQEQLMKGVKVLYLQGILFCR